MRANKPSVREFAQADLLPDGSIVVLVEGVKEEKCAECESFVPRCFQGGKVQTSVFCVPCWEV